MTQLGGLFSFVGNIVDWATHGGNRPGDPTTRFADSNAGPISDAVVANIKSIDTVSRQGQLVMLGVGVVGVALLFGGSRK